MGIQNNIPKHIAIILDGNGRWAKKRLLPRNLGHKKGSENVKKVVRYAADLGVEYVTLYAFSTENWNRPKSEVDALMKLLRNYLKDSIKDCTKDNMRIKVIGDTSRLDDDIKEEIIKLEEASKNNTRIYLQIAINYGGRDEIIRATKKMLDDAEKGKLKSVDISEDVMSSYLDTSGVPDPDLLIRTSGEMRISNFLIWEMAYTEYYFTDTLWPDFGEKDLDLAIKSYNGRTRKYGKINEQLEEKSNV